ncbi:Peroxisome biogenesis factor 10 [Apostasia shenzhenica]|uniref:Peroxisome biogenesis factor 10 n=1 Tax=Apostasia shenzhenica TaxID=1088818 RepID=A0A2I0AZJ3_9ASPA|nr:Peroxisome biogenesis factor 10 [Apostasia shenzhenica]
MSTLKEPSSTICGHVFCHECITMAVNKLKKCPTCRRKLNKKSIHRIFLPPL